VRHLPGRIRSHVACEVVRNLDQFPVDHLHHLGTGGLRFQAERALRKSGVRRHLGSLIHAARASGAPVLHSHFGNHGWANSRGAGAAGLRHVVTFYGADVSHLPATDARWYARYRDMFTHVDLVLCEGPFMAGAVRDLGCPADKLLVHHLGVDPDRIPFRPRQHPGTGPLRVLLAATFREKKGIPDGIEALASLAGEGIPLEITLIGDAADPGRDGPEKQKILDVLLRTGLESSTRRLGFTTYAELLAEADTHHVFLAPSRRAADGDTEGGAPVTLIEMAAAGMPIVSTTHCDIPEVVVDGKTGMLAGERDTVGLSRCLRWWHGNPNLWPAVLAAGRERVETEFNAARQGERLACVYERLAG